MKFVLSRMHPKSFQMIRSQKLFKYVFTHAIITCFSNAAMLSSLLKD